MSRWVKPDEQVDWSEVVAAGMRVLTVRQPFAWAIVHGGKDVENRSRNIAGAYRGPVAIHAARAIADGDVTLTPPLSDVLNPLLNAVPPKPRSWWANRGEIIGVVDLVDVHRGTVTKGSHFARVLSYYRAGTPFELCSPWAEWGAWHLELANPRPLTEPIPYRGGLGLRRLDDVMVQRVLEAVAS